ncbi:MAG: VWA domain-containing protein [Acidobacteriia bacterium]|nr:VWA domain-containing protein [Terriglobia bacterium]
MALHLLSRRRFSAATVLGTACFGEPAQTPDKQAAFRSTTNLVLLEVDVLDKLGLPITGLKRDDFRIRESGRLRPIAHFSTGAEQVCVGLVIDFSRSMQPIQAMVASAVAQFGGMLNAADELFLVLFNESILFESHTVLLQAIPPHQVPNIIASTRPDGMTALYDATLRAAELMRDGRHSRRVLVILSDGEDTASRTSLNDALTTIQSSNYTIGMFAPGSWGSNAGALRRLAETTGGLAVFDPDSTLLKEFFERVIADLRARYVIGFLAAEPPLGKSETRNLNVEIVHPHQQKARIRTRKHYRI